MRPIWPSPKIGQCQPRIIISVDLESPMLKLSFKIIGPLDMEKNFKGVLQYMGVAVILVM